VLTTVKAGRYTIRGISVGGVYTTLLVPELSVMFDVGVAPRSFGSADALFLSHGHADHIGALPGLLGLRGLMRRGPLRLFMPKQIVDTVVEAMTMMSKLQRYELTIEPVGLEPGDEVHLSNDVYARAFPTFHPVPSLGYQLFRRVKKLRPELRGLPGPEIAERRKGGEDVHVIDERLEVAYATDTLVKVLDETPSILESRVLIVECSFLDDRKSLEATHAGCHIHLDEIVERAAEFDNEHLVLMHFSQIYAPAEVHKIIEARLPADLFERVVVFAPDRGYWPG
jgi:ribonuclease Z